MRIRATLVFGSLICAMACASSVAAPESAKNYPEHAVKLIVGFPPGGAVDTNARLIAQELGKLWGKQVVIENRGGAGSTIGSSIVAQSPPDGYTMMLTSPAHAINATLYKKLPYDTQKSFTPVTEVVASPLVLYVHPSIPAKSVKELIDLAKKKPGVLNFAVGGFGTSVHLAGVLFNTMAGTNIVSVPYQGGAPALVGLLNAEAPVAFGGIEYMTYVQSGKLRALGVSTAKRSESFPDLPTVAETGLPGFDVEAWYGLYVTGGTPRPVVNKLQQDVAAVLRKPDVRKRYREMGFTVIASTPEQFAAFTDSEIQKWRKVIEIGHISTQ